MPQMSVWTGRRELTVLKSEFTAVAAEVVLQLLAELRLTSSFWSVLTYSICRERVRDRISTRRS